MHRLLIGTVVLALAVVAVRAADDDTKMQKPKEIWNELLQKYNAAKTPAAKGQAINDYAKKFLECAEKNAKKSECVEAVGYIMQLPLPDTKDSPKVKAVALMKDCFESKDLARPLRVKALTVFMEGQEGIISGTTDANKLADARKAMDEARKVMNGDLKGSVKDLFVGATMPELSSKDLNDKEVKLSELKGKVVVLDIWATWCPPCRAMIPHERELVKKMKDKQFVLVSVSADAKKETLTKFMESNDMPWTHWWNGQSGGILSALDVRFFPTIYVLDGKGVIRYKGVRGDAMDKAVETLLKETEDKTKGKTS
jgi:thiol-disulfide isomerase/thioredoxin